MYVRTYSNLLDSTYEHMYVYTTNGVDGLNTCTHITLYACEHTYIPYTGTTKHFAHSLCVKMNAILIAESADKPGASQSTQRNTSLVT